MSVNINGENFSTFFDYINDEKRVSKEERKNIEELFANFDGEYQLTTVDWGKPVGKENFIDNIE